ncbi:MAG: glycosyltransferase family 1 protein [Bacteroidota bacterium]
MRIAINTRFLLPQYLEGLGNFTLEVSRRLVEQHPEHDFLFCFDRPYDPQFVFGERTKAKVIFPPARHPWLWQAWFEFALPRVLRSWQADVFFSPDGYCSLRSQVPTLMVTHDLAFLHYPDQVPDRARRYYQKWTPRFIKRAERVITVSEFVRQDIMNHYGTDPTKISVACNGVRPIFKPLDASSIRAVRAKYSRGQAYFFYLGSVHPRKNLSRLIQAYAQFRAAHAEPVLLLLGGRLGWQLEEVQRAHRNSPFAQDIHFLGYLPTEDAARLLAASLALVYPSLSEGFGVPVLEAMQTEVPVITSQVTSLPEVAGDAALLIDPKSTSSVAEALSQIAQSAELQKALVAKGRVQRERFSWDLAAQVVWKSIEDLYQSKVTATEGS